MQKVSDCGASVFVSLYQAILGEGVPDYIAVPRSQEDDSHNVQAVIDSLALDYLQISLSHITGENIVRGNKESIKNLLDIFDGLLEYLTEQISETFSQSGDDPDPREKDPVVPRALWEDLEDQHKEALPAAKPSSSRGSSPSSLPSWDAEGFESTTELIRLGDSAHTFTTKQDTSEKSSSSSSRSATHKKPGPAVERERAKESSVSAPKRVAFRTQPDVRLLSLQGGLEESGVWSSKEEGDPTDLLNHSSQRDHRAPKERTLINDSSLYDGGVTEPLSRQRVRNKLAEQELQEMSAKLSRRLEELDLEQQYKENLYKDAPRTPKRSRIPPAKPTPHTPRASQGTSARGIVRPSKAPPMKIKDNDLLPLLLEEFPCLHVSPHALNKMWKQQFRQIEQLTGSVSEQEQERSRAKLNMEVEEAQRKYELLVEIIRKEQEHNQRLKDFKDLIRQQKSAQSRMREQRQQVARAKKYYNDYHVQLRARMLRSRTREERILQNLFEEGLEIQQKRVRELRSYAKDQREEHRKKHKEELESMENYYKDQFSMLAETLAQEQQEIQVRKKAQEKALQKMKKELRGKMEREIGELQEMIVQNDDDVYFRELEAERLSRRVHMASFQYSASHLL
ncbi:Centrosomal protein of 95 kDa [Acipenser ruthenus]|uniref:Centrosomal protein of 95 kDa n=1 Tax=Acipenser ruthenus TaxID=7906 RepID=A0A444UNP6_ACIRT|nr:Centrosomal protein of 95 kDa [Acipenser ruthenus]